MLTGCTHRIAGDGTLICQRTTDHDPKPNRGHVYHASWASDAHDRAEAES